MKRKHHLKIMKKTSFIILISLLLGICTGCGAIEELAGEFLPASDKTEPSVTATLAPTPSPTPVMAPAMEVLPETETDMTVETVSEDVVSSEPVTIVFAGDINFDTRYANMNSLISRGGEISDGIDGDIIYKLREADIAMLNNEFPYSTRGTPTPNKKFTFRSNPETVRYMTDMGIDIVGLANNHAYDHGPDALLDTFETLSGANIRYVGAGKNIEEAMTPEYFEIGGMKIAFTAATQIERSLPADTREATETDPGVLRTLDPEKYLEVIREADANSDFTIAFVHWGSENVYEYEAAQTELAEKYVEAGADLIIGAHPHVIQGFDYIDNVPVIYSMGNFWFSSKTLDSCLIEATLYEGELQEVRFIPCVQKGCFTSMKHAGDGEFERIIRQEAARSSSRATITNDGLIVKAGSVSENEDAKNQAVAEDPDVTEQTETTMQEEVSGITAEPAADGITTENVNVADTGLPVESVMPEDVSQPVQ